MMHGLEKSDSPIGAMKSANKPANGGAESMEQRGEAKGNTGQKRTYRTQIRARVSQRLARVRQAARERKKERFTALLHHVNPELLNASFHWLKRKAAAGVDGMTWSAYEESLESNLDDLCQRIHRGSYRAKPSRRRYIPKPDGQQRPLGIASLEDKIVQRALVEVLNSIYEEDFKGFSYGFRPGRGQHDALDALAVGINRGNVNWILDADISKFFDTVGHEWLIRFVEHRVGDQRVIRLIRKWLKAGCMENGVVVPTEDGTPQGAVISPLLANIYLHYVFDLWAQQWRQRHARGPVILVRYADDIVAGFCREDDAKRFQEDMRKRLEQFALKLHPDKTRLIQFGRFAAKDRARAGLGKPDAFNFLGFTHICGRDRSGVRYVLKRKSRRDRMRAKLKEIKEKLRRRMHHPIPEQGKWLRQVVQGYFNYHAVPNNGGSLNAFRHHVTRLWMRTLRKRSQRDKTVWKRICRVANIWLPLPRILHPWPEQRFAAKHPGWKPGA
jgi:RNA-directed DNA polymerase